MSLDFGKGDILFEQRLLACAGVYFGKLDGLWGTASRKAAEDALLGYAQLQDTFGKYDARSDSNIVTLLPCMQKRARQILQLGQRWEKDTGLHVSILSGSRTYAEQDALFSQRPKVTNARGGQSNHNFGIAIDIGLFDQNGKYYTGATQGQEKAYIAFAQRVKASVPDIEWGGDWKSIVDAPHFQYKTGLTLAQTRAKFEAGKLSFP